jgi:mannosyl-oligosaccharide glucosidase
MYQHSFYLKLVTVCLLQGIEGPVELAGFTPDLGEFAIRIEDDHGVTSGPRHTDFKNQIGQTHFLGRSVPDGNIWQAKGMPSCYT